MHLEAQPLNQADNGAHFGATPRRQRNAIVGWFEWLGGSLYTLFRTIFAWCAIVVLIQVLSGALREDAEIRSIPIEIEAEQMKLETSIPVRLLSKEEKKSCLADFTKAKTNNMWRVYIIIGTRYTCVCVVSNLESSFINSLTVRGVCRLRDCTSIGQSQGMTEMSVLASTVVPGLIVRVQRERVELTVSS